MKHDREAKNDKEYMESKYDYQNKELTGGLEDKISKYYKEVVNNKKEKNLEYQRSCSNCVY